MWQLIALIVSVLVEVPIVVGLVMWLNEEGSEMWPTAALAAAATLLTHPFAWMGSLFLMRFLDATPRVLIVECGVVVAEALFFLVVGGWPRRTAIVSAFVANAASMGVGMVVWRLF